MAIKLVVSIDSIANLAGVSRGTVSRSFNKRSDISPKTREKVLEIARKNHYFPNSSARGLARGRTETVGIVVPEIINPFLPEMITAIEKAAGKHEMSALLAITEGDISIQEKLLNKMASGQVDGILITPCESVESINMLNHINHKIPLVCLKNFAGLRCSSVSYDDGLGVRLLIEHLYELGHRRIAYIYPAGSRWTVKQRIDAYNVMLDLFSIEYRKLYEINDDPPFEDIWKQITKMIFDSCDHNMPTAILAFDDIIGMHLMKAAETAGYSVPRDISIAGFDNIAFSMLSSVPLTTVCVNRGRLGETAIDILIRQLRSEIKHEEIHHVTLTPELLVRKSTAAPPSPEKNIVKH